jgi:hypothetical protein
MAPHYLAIDLILTSIWVQTLTFNFKTRSRPLISMTTLPGSTVQCSTRNNFFLLFFGFLGPRNVVAFAGEESLRGSAVRDSNHKPALWQTGALT